MSPSNGATNIKSPVTLAWQAVANANQYKYELFGPDDNYKTAIESNTITSTSAVIKVNLVGGKIYKWQVYAIDANSVTSSSSPQWSFTMTTAIDPPTLIAPADKAIDVPIDVTFTWSAVANASSYDIEVSKDASFATKAISKTATVNNLSTRLSNGTKYYWHVRGKNGTWSTDNSFTTIPFIATAGIDAAISYSRISNPLIGNGIINNDGSMQTVDADMPINRQAEFYITVKNTGNVPDSFVITSNDTVDSKWKVNVYDGGGVLRTTKVFRSGWVTNTIKPGEYVKIMLRFAAVCGQKIDAANPPTQSIMITAKSMNDITTGKTTPASDTVKAVAVLTQRSN